MNARTNTTMAEAGRRGDDIRSDCWVRITLVDTGAVEVSVKTKVESMYGDSIRRLVADELASLGIQSARVEIEDTGALPFVIMARVETAARRLGLDVGEGYLPEAAPGMQQSSARGRLRRSRLYLPGNEPKFMLNAALHAPDGIILDLEDSVAPSEKDAARVLARNALRVLDLHRVERMVRINQGHLGLTDLDFVVAQSVHVVLIPKVESADQVRRVDARVKEILARQGMEHTVFLMPIVESALGAMRAYEIATASESVVALTIGLEDYTADIGAARTVEGKESLWARSQVLNAARAAGVQPIDSVFADVADMDSLRASVLEAKALGFEGKGCIHPRQIAVIHEAFTPNEQELAKARRIVEAFHEAQARGLTVVSLGTKMIDPPVVKRAERLVRLAEAIRET
ncbi:MAG: aldolase/citrate lyase family protein [Phycisphaerae bacterium]